MAALRTIRLSGKQRQALEASRHHDERPYVRERCSAIVKIAEGQPAHSVARHGLLRPRDPDTVYGWLQVYETEGLAGLIAHQHGGPRRRLL
ncbi:MAG: hypothetical protein ACT4QE_03795 [Anaerolineales bacterium]